MDIEKKGGISVSDSKFDQVTEDEFPKGETMKGGDDEIDSSSGLTPFRPSTENEEEMIAYADIIVEHERRSTEVDILIGCPIDDERI